MQNFKLSERETRKRQPIGNTSPWALDLKTKTSTKVQGESGISCSIIYQGIGSIIFQHHQNGNIGDPSLCPPQKRSTIRQLSINKNSSGGALESALEISATQWNRKSENNQVMEMEDSFILPTSAHPPNQHRLVLRRNFPDRKSSPYRKRKGGVRDPLP